MEESPKASLSLDLQRDAAMRVIQMMLDGGGLRDSIKQCGLSPQSFYAIISKERELAAGYARAQEMHADLLADEILAIADGNDDPAKARNRITVRQWLAGKKAPKTYGERIDLNVTQTIDVLGTLTEARARIMRPMSDQQQDIIDVTPIESSTCNAPPTDKQSVPIVEGVPDIFD